MDLDQVLAEVGRYPSRHVTVTGGEPLAQRPCLSLLERLCDVGWDVSLETSGALDISGVDPRVARILDIKTPGSGESARNHWPNLSILTPRDEVKFVLASEADYDWARERLDEYALTKTCPVLFSPVWGAVPPAQLAEWILRDGLNVRLQVQLHKILWQEAQGR